MLSAVNEDFGAAFEEHLDLGIVFDGGGDTDAEVRMLHHITGLISFFGGIGLRRFRTTSLQKTLIAGCPRLAGKFGSSLTWLRRFVGVLRIARIAVHAGRFGADQCFDGVGEHHFALAAPAIDSPARSIVISFHYFFLSILIYTHHSDSSEYKFAALLRA